MSRPFEKVRKMLNTIMALISFNGKWWFEMIIIDWETLTIFNLVYLNEDEERSCEDVWTTVNHEIKWNKLFATIISERYYPSERVRWE